MGGKICKKLKRVYRDIISYFSNEYIDSEYSLQSIIIRGVFMVEVLKVSSQSKPKAVAGALAAVIREKKTVEIQAVGAGSVNQAVKAIAIARGYVASNGIDLIAIPAFSEINIDGEVRTAIRFVIDQR
jgi:stage V sporulation protein S